MKKAIYHEYIIFLIYVTDNRFSKCMKQKPTELKKNNNSTVIVGDNTPFSIIDRKSIKKEDLNNTVNQLKHSTK